MSNDENTIKRALLGGSQPSEVRMPTIGRLLRPLPRGAVTWAVCAGCGSIVGIAKEGSKERKTFGIKELAEISNFTLPPDKELKTWFVVTRDCELCPEKGEPKAEFRRISESGLKPL